MPIVRPPADGDRVDAGPIVARGIAVKRSGYLAMGPAPGRCGREAIVGGDATHVPRDAECRQRVIVRLNKRDGHDIQERLASAQVRMEASTRAGDEEEQIRKRARTGLADSLTFRDRKAMRQHRAPRRSSQTPFPCSLRAAPEANS